MDVGAFVIGLSQISSFLSWNFSLSVFFSCILTLLFITIKAITTKTYDRRASGDCGTSGRHYRDISMVHTP